MVMIILTALAMTVCMFLAVAIAIGVALFGCYLMDRFGLKAAIPYLFCWLFIVFCFVAANVDKEKEAKAATHVEGATNGK